MLKLNVKLAISHLDGGIDNGVAQAILAVMGSCALECAFDVGVADGSNGDRSVITYKNAWRTQVVHPVSGRSANSGVIGISSTGFNGTATDENPELIRRRGGIFISLYANAAARGVSRNVKVERDGFPVYICRNTVRLRSRGGITFFTGNKYAQQQGGHENGFFHEKWFLIKGYYLAAMHSRQYQRAHTEKYCADMIPVPWFNPGGVMLIMLQ